MTATLDIIENTSISLDKDGYRVERIAIVEGVTGATNSEKIYNAINDVQLPNLGDAHPDIASITLNDIQGRVIDNQTVEVTLSYYSDHGAATGSANATVRASSGTTEEETNTDIYSNRLHFYTNFNTASGFTFDSGVFTAEVQQPRLVIDFEYTSTTFPYDEIKQYMGKVNSIPWNGYPAKTILCTAINANEEGDNYRVSFSFAHKKETWQFYAALKSNNMTLPGSDHATKPDALVDLYAAAKFFDVYESVDFTPLSFDLGIQYAEISGSAVTWPRLYESDIVTGGKQLVITLYGGETWVASGATFDAQRQNIIDGLVSNKSEAAGWNAELALTRIVTVANVVRTSDTVVTITFAADAAYQITETENISVTIPATALVTSSTDMETITPSFPIAGAP